MRRNSWSGFGDEDHMICSPRSRVSPHRNWLADAIGAPPENKQNNREIGGSNSSNFKDTKELRLRPGIKQTNKLKPRKKLVKCTSNCLLTYTTKQKVKGTKQESKSKSLDSPKGQLNSEWIYEVIISPKMKIKNYKDFCPTIQTSIVALFLVISWWFFGECRQFFLLRSLFVW